jgi:hypothetical protein
MEQYEIPTAIGAIPEYPSLTRADGEWAMAWSTSLDNNIYIIRFNDNGVRTTNSRMLVNGESGEKGNCPSLLWTGEDFVMVYTGLTGADYFLRFIRIDINGNKTIEAKLVNTGDKSDIVGTFSEISLAWNGHDFAIAWANETGTWYAFFEDHVADGLIEVTDKTDIDSRPACSPSIEFDGEEYVLAWLTEEDNAVHCITINLSGEIIQSSDEITHEYTPDSCALKWRTENTSYYIGMMDKTNSTISLSLFDKESSTVEEKNRIPCKNPPEYFSLAYKNDDFALVWIDNNHIIYFTH